MNLIWRFIWVLFVSRFHTKIDALEKSTMSFHVLPTDADVLLHMNNGRYLSLMDLGRINYSIRCGMATVFKKHKIYPVIASEMIRFKKSIDLFQRFELITHLIGWDDKFVYMTQYFKCKGKLCALGIIKACFLRRRGGRVPMEELIRMIGKQDQPPLVLPDWVQEWVSADKGFYDEAMGKSS